MGLGSKFDKYLIDKLKDDEFVFYYIEDILDDSYSSFDEQFEDLIRSLLKVLNSRGLGDINEVTRKNLHKLLKKDNGPTFDNVMAILKIINLPLDASKIKKRD